MRRAYWTLLIGTLAFAGCRGDADRDQAGDDTGSMMGRMDSGDVEMGDMPMQRMPMMRRMRAHMDSMRGMSPERMQAMMAMHERMMAQMMDGMGSDMRRMARPTSPGWDALADSVNEDLAELPRLEGQALSDRMKAHADRVRRLMETHESMMGR